MNVQHFEVFISNVAKTSSKRLTELYNAALNNYMRCRHRMKFGENCLLYISNFHISVTRAINKDFQAVEPGTLTLTVCTHMRAIESTIHATKLYFKSGIYATHLNWSTTSYL